MKPPPDDWRVPLAQLRAALLRLHKTLLDAERLRYEIEHGPIKSNGEYLQLLIHNPRFTWLQPFTSLIVNIDETEESKEPVTEDMVESLWKKARELTTELSHDAPLEKLMATSAEVKTAVVEVVRLR